MAQVNPATGVEGIAGFSSPQKASKEGVFDMHGGNMQVLNMALKPGQSMLVEPGSLLYMGDGVNATTECGNCCTRVCGGEKCILMKYTNAGATNSYAGFVPSVPADIVAVDLSTEKNGVRAFPGAFLTGLDNAKPGAFCLCTHAPMVACCTTPMQVPNCLQHVTGDGMAFLTGMGTTQVKELGPGETIVLDFGSIIAWTGQLGARCVPNLFSLCCGGDGCCYGTVTGPGKVWIKSYNWKKYKANMGVTITTDAAGNVKHIGGPANAEEFGGAPDAPDAAADPLLASVGIAPYKFPENPNYEIFGTDMQILRIKYGPGMDKVEAEPGAMVYMSTDVQPSCNCKQPCGRCISGSPCFMETFSGNSGGYIGLTPNRPAKVIAVTLGGKRFLAKNRAYMASIGGASISFDCDCNPCTACCGGQGCVRQSISGDGTAFLGNMGETIQKELAEGEKIQVDQESVVAWQDTVKLSIRRSGGCFAMCCGGEGMFNTVLEGPGTIYVSSYAHAKFKKYAVGWYQANKALASKGGAPDAPEEATGAPPAADEMDRDVELDVVDLPANEDDLRRRK